MLWLNLFITKYSFRYTMSSLIFFLLSTVKIQAIDIWEKPKLWKVQESEVNTFCTMATLSVDILFGYFMVLWPSSWKLEKPFLHERSDMWSEMYQTFPFWMSYTIFFHISNLSLMVYLRLKKCNKVKMCYTFVRAIGTYSEITRTQNSELRNYLLDHILIYRIKYNVWTIMFT